MAFGDNPDVLTRGRRDGARYDLMHQRGELTLYPGRVTPVSGFLGDVVPNRLAGVRTRRDTRRWIRLQGPTRPRILPMDRAGIRWRIDYRSVSGQGKDGGPDLRAMQRLVLNRKLKLPDSLALVTAVSKSEPFGVIRQRQPWR